MGSPFRDSGRACPVARKAYPFRALGTVLDFGDQRGCAACHSDLRTRLSTTSRTWGIISCSAAIFRLRARIDKNGNPTAWSIQETDGTNTVTHDNEATFDVLDRKAISVVIDRLNSSNRYTTQNFFDSRSNLVFRINAEGNPTRWTFDGLSRMTQRERALTVGSTIDNFLSAQITQWGFDKNDRMVSHKDDGVNESTQAFDALNRAVGMTYPDQSTVSRIYDAANNATQVTDPSGNVIADTFDALNRNTARTITLATGFLGTTSESRTYDPLNRLTATADNDYGLDFAYTVIGLRSFLASETQSYVGMTA